MRRSRIRDREFGGCVRRVRLTSRSFASSICASVSLMAPPAPTSRCGRLASFFSLAGFRYPGPSDTCRGAGSRALTAPECRTGLPRRLMPVEGPRALAEPRDAQL